MQLSKTEEELMNFIWKQQKAYLKDLLDAYPEPKPAITTIATLLKRMTDKGFIAYKSYGRSRGILPNCKEERLFFETRKRTHKEFLQ